MSKGISNFVTKSILAVGGAFGGAYIAHLISGKPYNLPIAIIISVSGIIGLVTAKCTGRLE